MLPFAAVEAWECSMCTVLLLESPYVDWGIGGIHLWVETIVCQNGGRGVSALDCFHLPNSEPACRWVEACLDLRCLCLALEWSQSDVLLWEIEPFCRDGHFVCASRDLP